MGEAVRLCRTSRFKQHLHRFAMVAFSRRSSPTALNSPDNADLLTALLQAAGQGDQAAFAELYALTSPKLYALLLRILRTRDWAEDALQDCYLRIWQKA